MRNVSKKYIETMETRRDFYAVGEITFADGTQKTLSKEDFSLTGNSVIDSSGSTSFPLGLLIPKQITLSLVNDDDRWSEYDFYGASIYLQTKFDLDDGTTESLNIGTFTVISPETYGTTVEVTAMDDSYKTDKPYDTQNDYPMSVAVALRDCCETCDILLGTTSFANSDYVIPQKPENLTHRQFIGLCAQIAGGNARFDEFNRLEIIAYDFSPLGITAIDGGTFQPWTKGENYDGGTFDPWTTGDTIDGGTFGDRDNIHVLYQYKSGIVIEVDDVVITGVQMESEDEEGNKSTHLYGKEGYVLSLENQLAVGKEEEVLRRIGEKIVGITFRPFSGDHIALPTAEFMDLAYIIDRKQNVYKTVLTDVTFNYFGYTNLKCTADSPLRNSSTHLSNEVKAIIEARKMVERERTEREKALDNLADQLAKSSGLYLTEDVQPDKSVIYYMHDKPTLEESMIVWKLTANAFGISNDGGKTYPYGLDASGVAILERIYAIGINADYITTGAFEILKNGKQMVLMDKDTGEVKISLDADIDGETLGTKFSAVSGAITSEVSRAKGAESGLSSRITQTANNIELCVKSSDFTGNNIISKINLSSTTATIAASKVNINASDIRLQASSLAWSSTYSSMTTDGKLTCQDATIAGTVKVGGVNDWYGSVIVYDKDNRECGRISYQGARLTDYSNAGRQIAYVSNNSGYTKRGSLHAEGLEVETLSGGVSQNYAYVEAGEIFMVPRGGGRTISIKSNGDISASGTKNRIVQTEDFGRVLQYCYETPAPMFGDSGEGETDGSGVCYIFFDPVFLETVSTGCAYQVILQKEGQGDIWVAEKHPDYFVVQGSEGLAFSWRVEAKQKDYEYERLEVFDDRDLEKDLDYEAEAYMYLRNYEEEACA